LQKKSAMKLWFSFLFISVTSFCQVGIGVSTPSNSSLLEIESSDKSFVPPRMTNTQMLAISSPLVSSMVFNTDRNSLFIYTTLGWKNMLETDNSILNCKKNGGNLTVLNNTNYNFPLNNSHIKSQNSLTYEIISDGKIKIKENGVFIVNAEISVRDMPAGTRGYSITIYKNNLLVGVLNKNETTQVRNEFWGTSGVMTFNFSKDDIIDLKYSINHNGSLNSIFTAFNFTKIK
jgi:hypothetical protein